MVPLGMGAGPQGACELAFRVQNRLSFRCCLILPPELAFVKDFTFCSNTIGLWLE